MQIEPLYRVGQQVVIASAHRPELNGQVFTVEQVGEHCSYQAVFTGNVMPPEWGYILNDDSPFEWVESSLRPYFPPSDQSFDEMMSEWTRTKERV